MQNKHFQGVYQCLDANPKCWYKPKHCLSTPGEFFLTLHEKFKSIYFLVQLFVMFIMSSKEDQSDMIWARTDLEWWWQCWWWHMHPLPFQISPGPNHIKLILIYSTKHPPLGPQWDLNSCSIC